MAKRKSITDQQQDNILARLDERLMAMAEKQDLIYSEVKKTNGRVTKIEEERLPAIESWIQRVKGAWTAIVLMAGVSGTVIGILITLFLK